MPTPAEIIEEQIDLVRSLQDALSKYTGFLRRAYTEIVTEDRLVTLNSTEQDAIKNKALTLRDDVKTAAAAL